MAETVWASAPLMGRIATPAANAVAQVTAQPLERLGLATVLVRKGQERALADKVRELYGLDLPDGPRRAESGPMAFVGTGPEAWLAVREGADRAWFDDLKKGLEGVASVSDQSDGYAAVRVEGPRVVDMLAKGVFLDLHPSSFPIGAAAGVSISHIGAIVWRRGETSFDLLCFRSFAASFWHWLEESAAEYGLAVLAP